MAFTSIHIICLVLDVGSCSSSSARLHMRPQRKAHFTQTTLFPNLHRFRCDLVDQHLDNPTWSVCGGFVHAFGVPQLLRFWSAPDVKIGGCPLVDSEPLGLHLTLFIPIHVLICPPSVQINPPPLGHSFRVELHTSVLIEALFLHGWPR